MMIRIPAAIAPATIAAPNPIASVITSIDGKT